MPDLNQLHDAVLNGDAKTAKAVTEQALAAGHEPLKLVQDYMMPAMSEVGRRFECNECFVPELLLAARAMKGSLELLRPLLAAKGNEPVGRVALGTVKGDPRKVRRRMPGTRKFRRRRTRVKSASGMHSNVSARRLPDGEPSRRLITARFSRWICRLAVAYINGA